MLTAIAANVVVLVAVLGFGGTLESSFPKEFCHADRLAIVALGGLGLMGTFLFDLGQIRFSRAIILLVIGTGLLACVIRLFKGRSISGRRLFGLIRAPFWPALIVGTVLAITAVASLAKPTGSMDDDSIAYHYLGPKVWLRDGAIRPVPDEPRTAFPALVESSYGALMSLGGPRAPALFSVVGFAFLLLIVAGTARRLGGDSSVAWWAATLVVTMPALFRGVFGGFIDGIYAAFVLAAARLGFEARRWSEYALFGAFCGFAIGTKYTGVIAVGLLLGLLIAPLLNRNRPAIERKSKFKGLILAMAIAAIVAVPAYARNWIFLGSPIYPPPPGFGHFTVKYITPAGIHAFQHYVWMRGRGMGRSLAAFLLLPFNLTYHTSNFNGAGGIGLAPLGLAPLGFIAVRHDRFARWLSIVALLLTIGWFATEQESRFLIHVYAILAVFAAVGIFYVARLKSRFGRPLTFAIVACSVTYGMFMMAPDVAGDLHAAVSPSYARRRERARVPFLDSFNYLNGHSLLKVLIPDLSVPTYYCNSDYIKPIGIFDTETVVNPHELLTDVNRMRRLHVSYVLDVRWYDGNFQIPEHLPGLELVFERTDQRIYRVE